MVVGIVTGLVQKANGYNEVPAHTVATSLARQTQDKIHETPSEPSVRREAAASSSPGHQTSLEEEILESAFFPSLPTIQEVVGNGNPSGYPPHSEQTDQSPEVADLHNRSSREPIESSSESDYTDDSIPGMSRKSSSASKDEGVVAVSSNRMQENTIDASDNAGTQRLVSSDGARITADTLDPQGLASKGRDALGTTPVPSRDQNSQQGEVMTASRKRSKRHFWRRLWPFRR
ncbi:MAG: hypothetical protein Q9209_003712 [Squamulea sp. 1 TL-2023]